MSLLNKVLQAPVMESVYVSLLEEYGGGTHRKCLCINTHLGLTYSTWRFHNQYHIYSKDKLLKMLKNDTKQH